MGFWFSKIPSCSSRGRGRASWAGRRFTASELGGAGLAALIGSAIGASFALSGIAAREAGGLVATARAAQPSHGQADAEEAVPPIARRVARFRIEFPDVDQSYPLRTYEMYPPDVVPLIRQAEMENDLCHSSGEDAESYRACNRRDALMSQLAERGWCGEGSGRRDTINWIRCEGYASRQPGEAAPLSWSEREIARVAWEVAEFEQPCSGSDPAHAGRRVDGNCAEVGFKQEDALLNAAYSQVMSGMAPPARARMRERQRRWLRQRDAGAAECAAQVAAKEASPEIALIRCRTGMTVPRRRDLQLVVPFAHQLWDGQADRDWQAELDQMSSDQSIEDRQLEYREWTLRHTERRAQKLIDAAQGAGGKAVAISLYYGRPYDPAMTADSRAAIAEKIARVARAMEQGAR